MTPRMLSANVLAALQGVRFIAQHIRDADKDNEVRSQRNTNKLMFYFRPSVFLFLDRRRLEICFDGTRSFLLVGIYFSLYRWYLRYNISSTIFI